MMFRRFLQRGRFPVCLLTAIWLWAGAPELARATALSPPPGVSVEYSAVEARLLDAAAAGDIDRDWLLPAALAACGERDEARIERAGRRVEAWGGELAGRIAGDDDLRGRAAAVLDFLHARVLQGGYRTDANDLAVTIEGGGYNCVGATVLFHCLAERCGLQVFAAESPGHVYSMVRSPSGPFDVETTCRDWFGVAAKPRVAQRSETARELSPQGLAALVYYNAGVDHLSAGRFAAAIAANLKALRLDPANSAARGNLLAGLNNWALDRNDRRDFAGAVRLLEHGLQTAPEHRPFHVNYAAVQQRWSDFLAPSSTSASTSNPR
jgi:tetratricopeptide (TPR) repeat protein